MVSWGNKASHSFDLDTKEATKLIDACEKAIGSFICPLCHKAVHRADDKTAGLVQCQCGHLQWRYSKA
jgi:hypothetical protein